jgi:hypothetical protein
MGNIRSRAENLEQLGTGQHIVADNVFESICPYGACMIRAAAGANQVIIRNNLFVNFNSSAVHISAETGPLDLPASNALVTGNIFDMTAIGEPPRRRIAVDLSASDVIVGDNQVYVRGAGDPLLTGIRLRDDALNVNVHDNLLQSCGMAISAFRLAGRIGEVLDPTAFLCEPGTVPLVCRSSHRYRGWNVAWLANNRPTGTSVIQSFDPETLRFTLHEPRAMKAGDSFEMFPSGGANWNIHDNTITGCLEPITLDSYGSETSTLRNNLVSRGAAAGVKQAAEVHGRFNFVGNQFFGFDEPGSAALSLGPDRLGRPLPNLYRDNVFDHCAAVVGKGEQAFWNAARTADNVFLSCGRLPAAPADHQ